MARKPGLDPEEEALWRAVAGTARPLHPARPSHRPPEAPPAPPPKPPKPPAGLPAFRLGARAPDRPLHHDLAPTLADRLGQAPVQMDRKAFDTMLRGRKAPEARLDLHGMTLAEAHPELVRFILRAHAAGMRLVLVITGKGKLRDEGGPMPARVGALRHAVPQWLAQPPLDPLVLQVAEAHRRHGGAGALYVYLRRIR
ncbi:MAG: Smr/MutS family protein [Gemmobacter sp.]